MSEVILQQRLSKVSSSWAHHHINWFHWVKRILAPLKRGCVSFWPTVSVSPSVGAMATIALTCSQTTDMHCSIMGLKKPSRVCQHVRFHPVPFTAPHVNRAVQEHLKLDVVNYMTKGNWMVHIWNLRVTVLPTHSLVLLFHSPVFSYYYEQLKHPWSHLVQQPEMDLQHLKPGQKQKPKAPPLQSWRTYSMWSKQKPHLHMYRHEHIHRLHRNTGALSTVRKETRVLHISKDLDDDSCQCCAS